jgi:hypothetical protein
MMMEKKLRKEVYNLLWRGYKKDEVITKVKNDPGYYGYKNDEDLLETIDVCGRLIFTNWDK